MYCRLSYTFIFLGKKFEGINANIGETINPKWFQEEGGKGKRYHKWSAINYELESLCDELLSINDEYLEINPGDLGFRFSYLGQGE